MENFFSEPAVIFSTGSGKPGCLHDTITNFECAIKEGSDVIRTNIGLTGDNKLVLFSDELFIIDEIARHGITRYTAPEIRVMYGKYLERKTDCPTSDNISGLLPELEEALSVFPGQRFNIHCIEKNHHLMELLKKTIENERAHGRVLVSAMRRFNTKWIHSELPMIPVAFSFIEMIGFYGLFKSGLIFLRKRFKSGVLIIPEMIGASYFANSGLINQAKKRGIRVYVNPVDDAHKALRARDAGADGIITGNLVSVRSVFGK